MPLLVATARFLARNGRMPEVIVVGIPHLDRTNELTPTHGRMGGGDGGQALPGSGGADRFLAFVEEELVPWVDRTYRTAPYRILAGHSFGGLFALYTLFERPDLFQARIAVSPTFPWDGDWVLRRTRELVAAHPDLGGDLVYTVGDEGKEMADGYAAFERALAAAPKLRAKGFHFAGEDHGTVVYPSHYHALRELFADWRMPVAEGAIGPSGGLAAVEAHYRAVSARLGYEIEIPEQVLNLAGYQLLKEGRADDAVRAFRRNVDLHPASPNVYDSLGEAYERAGDLLLARDAYKRAWILADRAKDPFTAVYKANFDRASAAADRKG
jgi:predicted alpha/beta superfamily hydrolase